MRPSWLRTELGRITAIHTGNYKCVSHVYPIAMSDDDINTDIGTFETKNGEIQFLFKRNIKDGVFMLRHENGLTLWGDTLKVRRWSEMDGCGNTDDLMLFESGNMAASIDIDPDILDELLDACIEADVGNIKED